MNEPAAPVIRTIDTRPVYDNPWIAVSESRVVHPSGAHGIYGVVHFKNRAVGVIAYEAGTLLLVGQYRYPLGAYSWEIPEGGCPPDEDLEAGARRELAEETGLVAEELELIVRLHLSNSITDELGVVYLARNCAPGPACPDETERLSLRRVTVDEAYAMVGRGEITDSLSVAGILRLMLMRHEGAL